MYMLQYTVPHFNAIKYVSHYQNSLYVYYTVDIHTQMTHIAPSLVPRTLQSHFTFPTDTLHTEFDNLCRSHKQF